MRLAPPQSPPRISEAARSELDQTAEVTELIHSAASALNPLLAAEPLDIAGIRVDIPVFTNVGNKAA
jgi:phage tail tape-measure protein